MKFGAHCYLFTERWSDRSAGWLSAARELGLDALEIAVGQDVEFDPERLGEQAREDGLELVLSPGGEWPPRCDLSSADEREHRRALEWHSGNIELARRCGAVAYTGAVYGRPGRVRPHRPTEREYARTADGLRRLADFAAERGVTVAIEPMSRFRTHLVNRPEQAMELVDRAGHPNLSVLLDTYHMVPEVRDYRRAVRAAGGRLWGVHACENDRGVPGGGLVPWDAVAAALRDVDFDGYVILETYNTSLGDFAARRGIFRGVCPDGREFVRQGLRFLRERLRAT